jgi:hypothetical protein
VALFALASAMFMAVYNVYSHERQADHAVPEEQTGLAPVSTSVDTLAHALHRKERMNSVLFMIVRVLTQGW